MQRPDTYCEAVSGDYLTNLPQQSALRAIDGDDHPVLAHERLPYLPDVPTSKEAGIANYEVITSYGILAPAGTPRDIVNRLNAEWIKIVAMADTREKLQAAGYEPTSSTPEQYGEFIKAEIVRWAKVIKDANIKIE